MRLTTLALLAAVFAASACSRPAAAPPAAAGAVRFDLAADPASLNPLFLHPDASSVEQQVARLSFEPFIDLDAAGHPVPALLDRIPTLENGGVSGDGRTIIYHLRRNVHWSDGALVTSGDVLYTLHAILDPRNPVRSREGYDLIDRANAPDQHTVVVHLRRAWAPAVMTYFSYGTSPQFVLPAHVLRGEEPLAQAPFNAAPSVGDGPFLFRAWKHGDSLSYVRNPHYWRGPAKSEALDVRIAPDPSTNLVMLQSGTLDWNLIAPAQYQIVARDPHVRFVTTPTAVVAALVMNTAHAPLDDVNVRRAIAMSVDRDGISKKITLGKYPVTNMMQPQFSWAYDPSIREPAYDPGAADAVFDAAGWRRGADGLRRRNGVPLHLTYVQFPESMTGVRVATTVQAALRERGIDVTIKSVSNAQLFLPKSGTLASGGFDLAYVPFTMGADPDDAYVLSCNGASNYMRWCDPHVDVLEARAIASVSQSERKALYGAIGRIAARDVPLLYLFNANYIYAYRDRLAGFAPNAFLPTWNAWSWKI
ncbi:MAG: peptide ABC transporter substrate-binding protein [Candidatus Eremiobacteraeota bacterium]|nr:peptide ABC transporter substrate-binding protein [Candidatus Eremiobacteraeota bacterium]